MNEQKMNFKVRNGLKNILGREMITSEVVAIFELVKNSCDAQAKNIDITIDVKEGKISVSDDGIGMSKEDIENKWLSLAHSYKKDAMKDDGTFFAGAKGIGRFACDRLGSKMTLKTKIKKSDIFSMISVDWDCFEKIPAGRFEDVQLDYKETDTDLIDKSGTTISIYNIRDFWDEKMVLKLQEALSKLINPFDEVQICNIKLKFVDDSLFIKEYEIVNNLKNVLKDKTTEITCKFSDKIYVTLNDRGRKIYEIEHNNDTLLKNITMQIFYLNKSAKYYFKTKMYDQKNYGSIFVYKNGFRVYPYGQIDFDPFKLDTRKTQGMMRYLGNREIIGCISIIDKNNNFIEVSSRDRGFITNAYVEEMDRCYLEYVHRPLEKYVLMIKWGNDNSGNDLFLDDIKEYTDERKILPSFLDYKNDKYEVYAKVEIPDDIITRLSNIENGINISESEKNKTIKDSKVLISNQRKTITNLNRNKNENEKTIQNLKKQNKLLSTLSDKEKIKQAEITHHISKMANNLNYSVEKIFKNLPEDSQKANEILKQIAIIKNISSKMKVFYNIILNSTIVAETKININLYEYFDFYINEIYQKNDQDTRIILNNIKASEMIKWNYCVDPYDVSVIIDNMFANAKDSKAKYLDILFDEIDERKYIKFFSDTPHIANLDLHRIFELGFSTKGGTGIGLFNIKKITKKYKWQIEVQNVNNGVLFVIELGDNK